MVTTHAFVDKVVSLIVAQNGERLAAAGCFFCIGPEACRGRALPTRTFFHDSDARSLTAADPQLLPLAVHFLRWTMETFCLELITSEILQGSHETDCLAD